MIIRLQEIPASTENATTVEKRGHRTIYCWAKKVKDKDYDVDNLIVGYTFCGEE